jgi:hypothetical protein
MTATQEPEGTEEQQQQQREHEEQEQKDRAEAAEEEAKVHREHRNVDETRDSMRTETDEEVTPEDNP